MAHESACGCWVYGFPPRVLLLEGAAAYEAVGCSFWATLSKVALALVPIAVMAVKQTTMMRASITAYSTAVGPSSLTRN